MPKNPKFEYDAKQPAFLQKLRGEYGDNSGRLERPAVRATRLKVNKDDDDDEPIYVDEESNEVISKEEYKTLVGGSESKGEEKDDPAKDKSGDETHPQAEASKQSNLTEVGGQRKRKQVKVVGEGNAEVKAEAEGEEQPKPTTKKPKKAKKIKLSFDEE
ncbi:unnamed protein product [Penicillium salamii]|uniref:DUF4604 domain-containing protein n=1 Tax=Penicillium salamii TaxID=1612424 RepID=A0A9W4NBG2_9EURO|nr:unnamed protein product [Penicillium salamii]CAG8047164.1 unnamed protein product [Penicillium salamii]CAG8336022.1 unnamed protein product [Penicillium salamii]CAG8348634.1 unnamed protein product [Penicillium salamii]CAG8348752.1 unnamed protein product [Penicillium salamii]